MAEETFETFVNRERARLQSEREAIIGQQRELETKLTALNREFAAIDAYEGGKSGKAARSGKAPGASRGGRGGRRGELLKVIKAGNGLKRGEILEKMGLKGDKQGEMSISNALTALTKTNQVRRQDGKY